MNVPKGFPGFDQKTILIVMDHNHGKAFQGLDRELSFVEDLETSDTQYEYSDHEGQTDQHNKEHYNRVFQNYILDKINQYEADQMFDALVIFCPSDIKGLVESKIPKHIMLKTQLFYGNYMKQSTDDLIKVMHPGLA